MIGQTIREFEIMGELGSGGYGVVYRAHDTSVDRDVAIKVILPQYANKPEFIANFEAEARLVAQLEHPHIVPLYSYWRDEQGAFLVMRYIRGGNLRGMLAQQGALPMTHILRIVEQIADALQVAHEAGVIHRDLKPDNILIDERGNAYLTDFGIAKQTAQDDGISATDAIKGTFAYLSPEQIQQNPVSPQTDIYALGIMLYEMLAGKHPFHETPVAMMVVKHLQDPLPDIRDAREDLPNELNAIIQRATAKDPLDRYPSTIVFINELKTAITGVPAAESTYAQPVAAQKKPTTPEERNRYAMLQNMRSFWVEGVLENSLHDAAMIDLGMKPESGAVDNPWDTLLRTSGGDESLTHDTPISNIFDRMNGKLLILGDPGSGKTTTLLTLARELLHRAQVDEQHPIPIVFNLSSWSDKQPPLTEWLVEELNGKYQVPRKVASQWVDDDELLLLLDGLDEVAADARDACVQAINDYRGEHGFVDVVVCSRIKDYEALTGQLKLMGAIVIQPLDDEQIAQYLDGLGADVTVVRDLIIRDEQLRELAKSPLMLSIIVLAYRGVSVDDVPDFEDVETQRQHLFDVYVERMFDRRVGEHPYTRAETRHYLWWLASKMQTFQLSLFWIEGLQPSWLKSASQTQYQNLLRMIHLPLIFAFYFLPLFLIRPLPPEYNFVVYSVAHGIGGVILGWMFTGNQWNRFSNHVLFGILYGFGWSAVLFVANDIPSAILVWIITGFASMFDGAITSGRVMRRRGVTRDNIVVVDRVQFDWHRVNWALVAFGFLSGITITIMFHVAFGKGVASLPIVIVGSLLAGLIYAARYVYETGLTSSEVEQQIAPNQGIRNTIRNANRAYLLVGIQWLVMFGIGISLVTTVRIGVLTGLSLAIAYGYEFWFIYAGYGVIQHVAVREILKRENAMPRNYARFLNYATSLILLRKVGGGYIFIHRYLLEYFADLDETST